MKKYLIYIIQTLFLSSLCVSGQAQAENWKFIDVPVKFKPTILHHSSDSICFTQFSNSLDIYLGENFNPTTKLLSPMYLPITKFVENDNYIFIGNANLVYKFDKNYKSLTKIIETKNNLKNYNLINNFLYVKSSNLIEIYDFDGKLIKGVSSNYGIISSDDVYVYHFDDSKSILYIYDHDLNKIKTVNTPKFPTIESKGNILFSNDTYSNDLGSTWTKINSLFDLRRTNIVHSPTSTLYRHVSDTLFYSTDFGKTFDVSILPTKPTHIFININDDVFIQNSNYCKSENIFRKNKGQNVWTETNIGTNLAMPFHFSAGINENLLYYQCSTNLLHKTDQHNFFEPSINFEIISSHHRPFYHLGVNRFLAISKGKLIKSLNNGKTWEDIVSFNRSFADAIVRKKDLNFLLGVDTISISNDEFKTLYKFAIPNTFKWTLYDMTYYPTNDYNVFTINPEDGLSHYNLNSGEIKKFPINEYFDTLNFNFYQMHTSFSGNTIYLYASDTLNNQFIVVSDDNYKNKKFKKIPMNGLVTSDHLNNLFLFKNNYLAVSRDKGDTWKEIGQDLPVGTIISDVQVSQDSFLYLATHKGILKYMLPINKPSTIEIALYNDTNKDCTKNIDELYTQTNIKVKINDSDFLTPNANGVIQFETQLVTNKVQFFYDSTELNLCIADSLRIDIPNGLPIKKQIDAGYSLIPKCSKLTASIEKMELKNCGYNSIIFKLCNIGDAHATDVKFEAVLPYLISHVSGVTDPTHFTDNYINILIPILEINTCKTFEYSYDISCYAPIKEYCVTGKISELNNCASESTLNYCINNYAWENDFNQTMFLHEKDITNESKILISDNNQQEIKLNKTFTYNGPDSNFTVVLEDKFNTNFDLGSVKVLESTFPYSLTITDRKLKFEALNGNVLEKSNFFSYTIKTIPNLKNGDQLDCQSFVTFDRDFPLSIFFLGEIEYVSSILDFRDQDFVISPNPIYQNLMIKSDIYDNFTVKIYNAQGQFLFEQQSESNHVELNVMNTVSQFLYIELITKDNHRFFKKVVKL